MSSDFNYFWFFVYFMFLVKFTETDAAVEAIGSFNCSNPPSFEHFDVGQCCRLPNIQLGNTIQNCQNQIKSLKSYNMQYPVYAHVCYSDCIYRETGALIDDKIHMEAVKNFLQNHIEQRDKIIVPIIVESFETCIKSIKDIMLSKAIQSLPKIDELGCSLYASMVYGCVNAETFFHCPQEMWLDERLCNLAKQFAQQCNPLPHVPMPSANEMVNG